MQHAGWAPKIEIRWRPGSAGENLVRRGAVYELLCKKKDERVLAESEMAECQVGKKCSNDGSASWPTGNAGDHACGRKAC